MRFRNDLVGTTTATLVLSVLNTGSAHGQEIARRINELSDGIFECPEETLYPALLKLENQAFIRGTRTEGPNGKKRCVYSLTEDGRLALASEANEWSTYSKAVATILEASYA